MRVLNCFINAVDVFLCVNTIVLVGPLHQGCAIFIWHCSISIWRIFDIHYVMSTLWLWLLHHQFIYHRTSNRKLKTIFFAINQLLMLQMRKQMLQLELRENAFTLNCRNEVKIHFQCDECDARIRSRTKFLLHCWCCVRCFFLPHDCEIYDNEMCACNASCIWKCSAKYGIQYARLFATLIK